MAGGPVGVGRTELDDVIRAEVLGGGEADQRAAEAIEQAFNKVSIVEGAPAGPAG
jgi:hypothetical protein